MIEPALMVGTIIMVLLMGSVSLIAVIFAARKPSPVNKGLRALSLLLLCYMLAAFIKYYFEMYGLSAEYVKWLNCAADIVYLAFIVSWLYVIGEFAGRNSIFRIKPAVIITLIYGIFAEAIVILGSSYNYECSAFIIESTMWRNVLLILNGCYDASIIIAAAVQLALSFRSADRGYKRNGALLFSGMLILYMIWIIIYDYSTVNLQLQGFLDIMIIDPLFIVYCSLAVAIICFFFMRDPLELFAVQDEKKQEEQMSQFAADKGLTARETEVLDLVCSGMSNPEIADKLCISEHTVKRHLNNTFQKAGVSNRYELISKVLKG